MASSSDAAPSTPHEASSSEEGQPPQNRPKMMYEEIHRWADQKAKRGGDWTIDDAGDQWVAKFKRKYSDDKSFKSLLELDENGKNRMVTIAQMEKDVEPRIGGVARQIIEKAKEVYKEDDDSAAGRNNGIVFNKWIKMPNGQGLQSCTAMPLLTLRQRITACRGGVVWVECPMGTAKTGLSQLLQQEDGFQRFGLTEKRRMGSLSGNVVIDEAQRLMVSELQDLREHSNTHLVVCCGVSCVEVKPCPSHGPSDMCNKCFQHECCKTERCDKGEDGAHYFVDSRSAVVHPSDRVQAGDLLADAGELEQFLFLATQVGAHPLFTDTLSNVVQCVKGITGLHIGLTMQLLKHLCEHYTPDIDGKRVHLTCHDLEQHARSLACHNLFMNFRSLKDFQFTAEEKSALCGLLLLAKQPRAAADKDPGVTLGKKGVLMNSSGQLAPSSPLHRMALFDYLFQRTGHTERPYGNDLDFVKYILHELSEYHRQKKFDIFASADALVHEDSINGCIAAILRQSCPTSARHIGPANVARGGTLAAQCDHLIYGAFADDDTLILEVLRDGKDLRGHTQRLNEGYTVYKYTAGLVLDVRDGRNRSIRPALNTAWTLDCPPGASANLFVVVVNPDGDGGLQYDIYMPKDKADPSAGLQHV